MLFLLFWCAFHFLDCKIVSTLFKKVICLMISFWRNELSACMICWQIETVTSWYPYFWLQFGKYSQELKLNFPWPLAESWRLVRLIQATEGKHWLWQYDLFLTEEEGYYTISHCYTSRGWGTRMIAGARSIRVILPVLLPFT